MGVKEKFSKQSKKKKKNIGGFLPAQTLSGFSASDESKEWKSDDYISVANTGDFQGAVLHFKGNSWDVLQVFSELLHFLNSKWTINNSSDSVGALDYLDAVAATFGAGVRERLAYPNNKLIIQIRCPFFFCEPGFFYSQFKGNVGAPGLINALRRNIKQHRKKKPQQEHKSLLSHEQQKSTKPAEEVKRLGLCAKSVRNSWYG